MASKDMLINYVGGEECRIAIVEDGRLEELYAERASSDIHVGNIYRGRVTNVEPSIQAAFVDFGLERNGFLHISDLHPRYFGDDQTTERVGKRTPRKNRPPIQQVLKRGDRILVQVLKEGIGTKGPTLTSYLSIPGRFLVMMPDMERHGVSRKVEDEDKRRAMRKILDELDPPKEFGFIVRTAGIGRTKTELKRDLAYLLRLWKTMDRRIGTGRGPCELYRESDLIIRTLRDVLANDIGRIIVDDRQAAQRASDFLRIAMPRGSSQVYYYDKPIPLFDAFNVEPQIASITAREVPMPSGGSLVIDSTEALVAIDVNSGKMRDNKDAETTAFKTNCEAVDEIARQLRLRDLGGVVVLDLIDMYQHKHRRDIEKRLKDNIKKDRARTKILRINDLGLLSMTRQRMRPGLKKALHQVCPTCNGHGLLMTAETVAIDAMRQIAVVLSAERVARAELTVTPDVGALLLNRKRQSLNRLETQLGKHAQISFDTHLRPDEILLTAFDERGVKLDINKLPAPKKPKLTDDDVVIADPNGPDGFEEEILEEELQATESAAETPSEAGEETKSKRRRRRRRRRKGDDGPGDTTEPKDTSSDEATPAADAEAEAESDEPKAEEVGEDGESKKPRRRRRRRGGRRHRKSSDKAEADSNASGSDDKPGASSDQSSEKPETRAEDTPKPIAEAKPEPTPEPVAETPPQTDPEPVSEKPDPVEAAEPAKKTKTKKKTTKKKTTKKKTTKKKTTKKKTTKKKTTKKKASLSDVAVVAEPASA